MILRPLEPPAAGTGVLHAWSVVERLQREAILFDAGCWMITQPSHAALAGEFAARFSSPNVPKLEAGLVRAIALHDAGWGIPDAQAIMQSRSINRGCPKSFIECGVNEFVFAWEKSIDVAASAGPAGGYIVSRHFCRLAEEHIRHHGSNGAESAALERFLEEESRRQGRLAAGQEHDQGELELLTDVLQFCDLLSLYVCAGAQDNAEFPKYFGVKARLTMEGGAYKLDPPLLESAEFMVAALRHPAIAGESGRQIAVTFSAG